MIKPPDEDHDPGNDNLGRGGSANGTFPSDDDEGV
jgi:hypothetical protein